MKYRKTILPCLALALLPYTAFPQSNLKTKNISIFKNERAFFIKSGEVPAADGKHKITENFPRALFGTFWFLSPELKTVRSYKGPVEAGTAVGNLKELLLANNGKQVSVLLKTGESVAGKISYKQKISPLSVYTDYIGIQSGSSWEAVRIDEIKKVSFAEAPSDRLVSEQQKPILELEFSGGKPKYAVEMLYLRDSLGWKPNYMVELNGDSKATLTLKAEMTNDAEPIENTDINFVVGVPNFAYANDLSSLVDFLGKYVGPQYRDDNMSNMFQQRAMYGGDDAAAFAPGGGGAPEVEVSSNEDLYFYTLKNISLPKGGRANFDLLQTEAEVQHIYEANLPGNGDYAGYYQTSYSFDSKPQEVMHIIKIKNGSGNAWTTGAAMVLRKDGTERKPISQDLLQYTPTGGETSLKLTSAPDIKVTPAEKETAREERAKKWQDYSYDLITVEGQIKVKNHKDKKAKMNVRRLISGECISSKPDWKIVENVNLAGSVNKTSQICWEFELDPGKETVIEYKYKVYIRN